jgi:hypothetical protein
MRLQVTQKSNTAVDSMFNKLEMELGSFVQTEAKQQGLVNAPKTTNEFQATVLSKIQSHIQEGIYELQRIITPRAAATLVSQYKKESQEKIAPLYSTLKELEHERTLCTQKKKQCSPNTSLCKARNVIYIAEAAIGVTEACLSYEALKIAGLSKFPALATSIGIGVAIGFGMHYIGRYIKQANNKKQQLLRYALVIIPAFTGFWALGSIRAGGYAIAESMDIGVEQNAMQHTSISGLTLAIISFLLFLVGLLFAVLFAKSKEEEQKDEVYQNALQEDKEVEKKIRECTQQIHETQTACTAKCKESYDNFEYAYSTEQKLQSLSDKLIAEFITINIRHRTDCIPSFFTNPPKVQYKTFFDSLKNNTHEKN